MNEIERAIEYLEPISKHPTMTGAYCEHMKVAIEALREQAEREKGCEFCCYQDYHDKTLYPKEGYVFYAGFSKQIAIDAFDEYETCSGVKFCPRCGKKLEVKHE